MAVSTSMQFLRKYFRVTLASNDYYLLPTIKERPLYSRKSFRGTLENRKNSENA